jgi:signal transduction histidine kinase
MVETIFRNLVSNTIKFSQRNSKVWVSAHIENNEVRITFEDQGIGIKKEILPSLFQLNQNKSTPGTEGEEGTGLGLLLCKEFVEKNNGKIWVDSTLGSGSSFNLTLPLTK